MAEGVGGRECPSSVVVFALHCLLISHFAGYDNTGFGCTFGTHQLSPGSPHVLGTIDLTSMKWISVVERPTYNGVCSVGEGGNNASTPVLVLVPSSCNAFGSCAVISLHVYWFYTAL